MKKFFDLMKTATIEREVEDVYNQGISLYFDNSTITHPFECDGLIDTKADGKMLKLIMEYKYDKEFASRVARANVIVQVLYYVKRFETAGLILPNVALVGDRNECFVFHVNDIIAYLDEKVDWSIAPSSAAEKNPDLVLKMANDDNLNPFVFVIDEHFDFKVVADKIRDLAANVQRYVHVTEHNIATIFEYFKARVVKDAKISVNDLVSVFLGVIKNDPEVYAHPVKRNTLVAFGKTVQIDGNGFKAFAGYFNRTYTPQEKMRFDEIADRLVEDTNRRKKGEFYTPTLFVDYAHRMIEKELGEDWREKYVVWDNCCYDEQTEFLSETGWKRISEYNGTDKVMQYNEDGTGEFVSPLAYIAKEYNDQWVSLQGSGIDVMVTKDHDLVVSKDYHDRDTSLFKIKAIDVYEKSLNCSNQHLKIPKSFSFSGNVEVDEWILRLAVAINADGHYNQLLTHDGNSNRTGRNTRFTDKDTAIRDVFIVSVKKHRKIERMRWLLGQAGIAFTEKYDGEYTSFKFSFPFNPKHFPVEWYGLSSKCKDILLDELFRWDGSVQQCRFGERTSVRKNYSTSKKDDADFIEFVIASTGHGLYVREDTRKGMNINYIISPTRIVNSKVCNSTMSISLVDGGKRCYCFTVPSGMLIVRRNHKIYVCGNCGTCNLTRDYRFGELYCSTLEQSELEIGSRYNPEAVKFQFDFLNDYIPMPGELIGTQSKVPAGLVKAFEENRPMVFFINPPYARAGKEDMNGINDTAIRKDMINDKLGAGAENLQHQFMYRIAKIVEAYKLTNVIVALFSDPIYFTGNKQEKWLQYWCNRFQFRDGIFFCASHFADVSDAWGITFNLWKNGQTVDVHNFPHHLVDMEDGEIKVVGEKDIYNIHGIKTGREWALEPVKKLKTFDEPNLSSGLKVVENGRGKNFKGNFGCFYCDSNAIYKNASGTAFFSKASTRPNNIGINADNFTKCTALFTARKSLPRDWMNGKDEYMVPDTTHEKWDEFEADSLVYSLFNTSSNQSSLRHITYKGNTYDIRNQFFWMTKAEMMQLAGDCNNDAMYDDARTDTDRHMAGVLAAMGGRLSPEAKAVLDKATEMVRKSVKYRELYNDEHPECHINAWDAGYYQLKGLWQQYLADDFKELRALYKALEQRLIPMVYELGFLRK